MTVELVILNYNGRHHLEHLLPTALHEAENYGSDCQVVVLDNCSTKDDVAWVRRKFSLVKILVAPRNEYLFSYNEYAKQSTAHILVFLNNDLKLCENFLLPLLRHFEQEDVFSVSATSRNWSDTKFTFGPMHLKEHHGDYYWNPDYERQVVCHTLFCSGGFMAVDRIKFLEIGGFNNLYYPAYSEDVDLCFRSWRKGWRCIYEPRSIVLHREHGSWDSIAGSQASRLMLRGKLLFSWSTLPRCANPIEEYFYLLYKSFSKFLSGERWYPETIFKTWLEWRKVYRIYEALKIDREELNRINNSIALPIG